MPFALARKEEMMTLPARLEGDVRVTLGVDTHAEVHVAVALDQLGRRLGIRSAPATPPGSAQLLGWASQFGPVGVRA
jgi:hypothetical protein